jgi:hypothetical protein
MLVSDSLQIEQKLTPVQNNNLHMIIMGHHIVHARWIQLREVIQAERSTKHASVLRAIQLTLSFYEQEALMRRHSLKSSSNLSSALGESFGSHETGGESFLHWIQ